MPTVAIIAEYNPFHNGHKYQIDHIRKEFGKDTNIIALMSGNFTQRGEVAILDKFDRARIAVECGVNLVLELPFPYSSSSAEIFAKSAIHILNSLNVVDYLSFGSECGDIDTLRSIATLMCSSEYEIQLNSLLRDKSMTSLGYPSLCEAALKELECASLPFSFTPNNILALEYIKALISSKSKIHPHTIKRLGAGYNEGFDASEEYQSASAIRRLLSVCYDSAFDYMPNVQFLSELIPDCIYDPELISLPIISRIRSSDIEEENLPHDLDIGLYHRIKNAANDTSSVSELVDLVSTKKYTASRVRRALLSLFFNLKTERLLKSPEYTQLLAFDSRGRILLKEAKTLGTISILTKPSSFAKLNSVASDQKKASDVADSVFHLCRTTFVKGNKSIISTPFFLDDE